MGATMSDIASSEFPAVAAPAAGNVAKARFTGDPRAFRNLMIRGALLQLVTLGIYRFWLTTDARRFLWANTEVAGDSLEYTGTAIELFLGFLIAIALLVPIFALIALGSLSLGFFAQISGTAGYLALAAFGQFAYFRARRYRLTRTVFRGLRFHQTGSATKYALRSLLWSVPVLLTLGLAYPWAQASLERYKMAHTHYGDLQGKFAGTGTALFGRGIALWLLLVGAFLAAGLAIYEFVDPAALRRGARDPAVGMTALIVTGVTFGFLLLCAFVYAVLQGIVLRWWLAGLRFGPVVVTTTLKRRRVVGAYVRCFLYVLFLLIVVSLVVGALAGLVSLGMSAKTEANQTLGLILVACLYLSLAVGSWVIYQLTIKFGIWRLAVDSVGLAGFDAIERVRADDTRPSSAVGEGLVDALGAGGI
jgi:uncharacterized membrane protein YjgN (DUF898 family)